MAPTIFVVATRQSIGTRAKDSDRNDTCQVLDTALAEGQLSMEEHRQRVSAATNAATLGELQALVAGSADLQCARAAAEAEVAERDSTGGGWGMRLAVAAVLVLLGVGIGWGIFGSNSPLSSASDPGAMPDGIAAEHAAPPQDAAFAERTERPLRAGAQEVGRHHGLQPDRLSRLCVDGAGRPERRPAHTALHLPGRLGRPRRSARKQRWRAWSTLASSTSTRSSAGCAARRKR